MRTRTQPFVPFLPILLLALAAPVHADSVHVAPNGDDDGTGGPLDPFATIQHAVTVSAAGDTILLHDGIFAGSGNREVDLQAKLLWIASISGDPAACAIDCGGLDGLVFEDDEVGAPGDTLGIAGVRFTNAGVAVRIGPETITSHGPVTRGCVLRDLRFDGVARALELRRHVVRLRNVDIAATDVGIHGIYLYGEMDHLRIAGAATGLNCDEWSFVGGNLVVRDSELLHNGYGFDGGTELETVEFVDCRVDSNTIAGIRLNSGELGRISLLRTSVNDNGGHGVWIWYWAGLHAVDSEIARNAGSGIRVDNSDASQVTLDDVEIHDNDGWGVRYNQGLLGDLVMRTTTVRGNGAGGCRTAIHDVQVEESLIADNGGTGLWLAPSGWENWSWEVTATTIAGNAGHGLYSEMTEGSVANTLVAANDSLGFAVADTAGLSVVCTDVHGNALGNWTGDLAGLVGVDGNKQQDPQFCTTGDNPYALVVSSPCGPDYSPCGLIGRYGPACEGVFVTTAELHEYDPVTGAYIGPYQFVPVTVEGVVFSAPGTYSSTGGGYLQDATGGVNFWHSVFPVSIRKGDLLRMTGPYWYAGGGEMFIGNPAWTVLDTGLVPVPTAFTPSELAGDLGRTASHAIVTGIVQQLTADTFVLADDMQMQQIEVRRTPYTGVSFAPVVAGQRWTVVSPVLRDGAALYLSPGSQDDLFAVVGNAWHVAPGGDDLAAGTLLAPFATLAHAATVAASGDTVLLHDGVFSGPGNREVELGDKLLWIASLSGDPASCVIDCGGLDGIVCEFAEWGAPVDTLGITGIRFTNADVAVRVGPETITHHGPVTRGCVLRDLVFDGVARAMSLRRHVVSLRNVDIAAADVGIHGIYLYGEMDELRIVGAATGLHCNEPSFVGGNLVVRDSELLHSGYGFDGATELEVVEFVDCRVDSNTTAGIRLNSGELGKVRLLRTRVSHNQGHGVWIQQMAGLEAEDSEIDRNAGSGIHVEFSGPCYITLDDMEIHDNDAWGVHFYRGVIGYLVMRTSTVRGNGLGGCRTSVPGVHVAESLIVDNGGTGLWLVPPLQSWGTPAWDVTSTTIAGNAGHGLYAELPAGAVASTLVAANDSLGFAVADTAGLAVVCTDVHGNAGGDWTGDLAAFLPLGGNLSADPCFCDPAAGNYELCAASPCLPAAPDFCHIGALGQGCGTPSDVATPDATPTACRLLGAQPNPFNPWTTVVYELSGPRMVTLAVYDLSGRLVRVLADREPRGPGRHESVWRGRDARGRAVATGVYLLRLEAGGAASALRVTLVR